MKKKKAAVLARKLEAEKQLAAKKSSVAAESTDKSSKESDSSTAADDSKQGSTTSDKSTSQAAPKVSLPPVPETTETGKMEQVETKEEKEKDPVASTDAPKVAFGSSSTLTAPPTFGMPKAAPMQSEPDCPKPSFFGSSSTTTSAPVFGSSTPAPTAGFGGSSTAPSTTTFGGGAAPSNTAFQRKDSGAFLNLTPPKTGAPTEKFVFGKSANITLAAPSGTSMDAAQTLASFGQTPKFGTTPFGSGFGTGTSSSAFGATSSPFGGGGGDESKKRPLSTLEEKSEEPDAKQSRVDAEGEVVADESSKTTKDEAAKEA